MLVKANKPQLSFFLRPLLDELLDSIVYWYHFLSGNRSPKISMGQLYGENSGGATRMLVGNIPSFFENAPVKAFSNTNEIVMKHTIWPAYFHTDMPSLIHIREEHACSSKELGRRALLLGAGIILHDDFHLCPICVKEDIKDHGRAYWHRSHQLEGVVTCHIHGCDLISCCPDCGKPVRVRRSMELPSESCLGCGHTWKELRSYPESVVLLSKLAYKCLDARIDEPYIQRVCRFLMKNNFINRRSFRDEFEEKYGQQYLLQSRFATREQLRNKRPKGSDHPDYPIWMMSKEMDSLSFYRFSDFLMTLDTLLSSQGKPKARHCGIGVFG